MQRVRVITALSLTGVLAAGVLATAVNTQIIGAVTAGTESSSESLRVTEEVVDPASVTPEQAAAAAVATQQQQARTIIVTEAPRTPKVTGERPARGSQSMSGSGKLESPSSVVPQPNVSGGSGTASAASTPPVTPTSPSDSGSPSETESPTPSNSGSPSDSPSATSTTSGSASPSTQ